MTADLRRMSAPARARAMGLKPDIPCPEHGEFSDGLEAFARHEPFDPEQPIAWRHGWRAGQAGRRLPEDRAMEALKNQGTGSAGVVSRRRKSA